MEHRGNGRARSIMLLAQSDKPQGFGDSVPKSLASWGHFRPRLRDTQREEEALGSSGFRVLRCPLGALPPNPRGFALWANSMIGVRGPRPESLCVSHDEAPSCTTARPGIPSSSFYHAIGEKRKTSLARPLRACPDHRSIRKPDEPSSVPQPASRQPVHQHPRLAALATPIRPVEHEEQTPGIDD
jgi:hypothetical protein